MAKDKRFGKTGHKQFNGIFYEEYLPQLRGINGIEIYKEMEQDDICGAILYAIDIICRQVTWKVNPAGTTEVDRKAADFIYDCLYDMNDTWANTMSEILTFLLYGWSWMEIIYKRRNKGTSKYSDGLIGWKAWEIRAQDTLMNWEIDEEDGDIIGLTQQVDGQIYTIPRQKSLHFRTKMRKGNPEGVSILRNSYRSWYYKKRFQEIEGIGIERDLAGLPMITPPEGVDIWNDSDEVAKAYRMYAEKLVQNVRRDTTEGVVMPYGWTFSLLSGGSKRNFDTGAVIERYDKRIAMTVLSDFILLGHDGVGSYSMANGKMDMFYKSLTTYLDMVQDEINVAIRKLMDLNAEAFKGITDYPELHHGTVETVDIQGLSEFLVKTTQGGLITPDESLEDFLRDAAKLPERPNKETEEVMVFDSTDEAKDIEAEVEKMYEVE